MAHFGAAGLKDVMDRLQVILHLGIAVDRDAALRAFPFEPDGDAFDPVVRTNTADVRRDGLSSLGGCSDDFGQGTHCLLDRVAVGHVTIRAPT